MKKQIKPLKDRSLRRAARILAQRDPDLNRIYSQFGPPPLWARDEGFTTLIHIILEQQVSLASAQAAHTRLIAATAPLTPERFLQLDDAALRAVGFSRQKTLYGRELALALVQGRLDIQRLSAASDEDVHSHLSKIKGIGRWTTDIYLLMALRRPDVWPRGDLALAVAVQQVKGLAQRPTTDELVRMSEKWEPYRAVAARMFWHYLRVKETADERYEQHEQKANRTRAASLPRPARHERETLARRTNLFCPQKGLLHVREQSP